MRTLRVPALSGPPRALGARQVPPVVFSHRLTAWTMSSQLLASLGLRSLPNLYLHDAWRARSLGAMAGFLSVVLIVLWSRALPSSGDAIYLVFLALCLALAIGSPADVALVADRCRNAITLPRHAEARTDSGRTRGTTMTTSSEVRPEPTLRALVVRESRLPVGSSHNSSAGRPTSARAIATRCRSPPDMVDGTASWRCSRLTALSASRARRRRWVTGRRR